MTGEISQDKQNEEGTQAREQRTLGQNRAILVKHRADFIQTAKSPGHRHSIHSGPARDFITGADYS